mgnify:CR=1 FL=1
MIIPGFVPSAGAKLNVEFEILAPLAVELPEMAPTLVTPPADGVVHVARPFASDVNTFPSPGLPEEIVTSPANVDAPETANVPVISNVFEGLVLARKHQGEAGGTFTVRKVASGVGMERIFPLYSPMIDKIEVTKKAKTRRSKLYYIREKAAKEIRRKMKQIVTGKIAVEEDEAEENAVA